MCGTSTWLHRCGQRVRWVADVGVRAGHWAHRSGERRSGVRSMRCDRMRRSNPGGRISGGTPPGSSYTPRA
jgi:hypothetical protein